MEVAFHKPTAMNFFMLFANSAANPIPVIGRRFAVKSVVEICNECEIDANRIGFVDFTFDCQGEHPTSSKGRLAGGIAHRADQMSHM